MTTPSIADLPQPRPGRVPDREECVEQAYFFRHFRERIAENLPAQDVLSRIHEEVLTTTRLPMAIQFVASELNHSGRLSRGFELLPHYFTPFQTFVVRQAEDEKQRLTMPIALLILEREAEYKAKEPTRPGLFVYQYESIARNRLGYNDGLKAMSDDPMYGPDWAKYIDQVRRQGGIIDFCDLVYWRSVLYVQDERRKKPDYVPNAPPRYAEREGKIAKAARGRDPLFLFAALQRQLNYPEIPRLRSKDSLDAKLEMQTLKLRELETRIRMLESETRGTFDPTQLGKPDMFKDVKDE